MTDPAAAPTLQRPRPELLPIRHFATLLAALLLALGLGLVGYCILLSLRRGPTSTDAPMSWPRLTVPAAPQRLTTAPEFAPTDASAVVHRAPPNGLTVPIRLRSVPAELPRDTAGVATFQAATGTDFVWTPISSAMVAEDGSLLIMSTALVRGDLVIALAANRSSARHGYLLRRQIALPATGVTTAVVELAVEAATVVFQTPASAVTATPLRLVRTSDPNWLPMQQGSGGMVVPIGGQLRVLLGAGSYEAVDPLQPQRRVPFAVPSPQPIDVSALQTRSRADRP